MTTYQPNTPIANLPLSARSKQKLDNLELETLEDVSRVDYSVVYEAIGHGAGKDLLGLIVQAGLKPTFRQPEWSQHEWHDFVMGLVHQEIVNWKDIALAICGELNPPQVGTAVASNPSFQRHFEPGKTMRAVMEWFYAQDGTCNVCGTYLFLEADHIKSKQEFREEGRDPEEADTLENLQLLCKRCNVVKRPSHALGGLSFGPAQAVLIWILLSERPTNKATFYASCRAHGLTMANVRFDEAWAFAIWLWRQGKYQLDLDELRSQGLPETFHA